MTRTPWRGKPKVSANNFKLTTALSVSAAAEKPQPFSLGSWGVSCGLVCI